jgi:hypothetical protein
VTIRVILHAVNERSFMVEKKKETHRRSVESVDTSFVAIQEWTLVDIDMEQECRASSRCLDVFYRLFVR